MPSEPFASAPMANQIESPNGKPRKDENRPSPNVGQAIDGQTDVRVTGTFGQHGGLAKTSGSGQHHAEPSLASGEGSPTSHTPLGSKPDFAGWDCYR